MVENVKECGAVRERVTIASGWKYRMRRNNGPKEKCGEEEHQVRSEGGRVGEGERACFPLILGVNAISLPIAPRCNPLFICNLEQLGSVFGNGFKTRGLRLLTERSQ